MNKKIILISDFDGTISKKDFFYLVIDELLKDRKDVLIPWNNYLNGKITHIEALSGIFSQIHLSKTNFHKFISKIQIDRTFYNTAKFCKNNNIPFYICSAGTNYYISKRIFKTLNKYNIKLISNDATYSKENGMQLICPKKTYEFYSSNTGISKQLIVKKFKNNGFYVIYAGDGKPDFEAAKNADAIFAKDLLLKLCIKNKIKTQKFTNFNDILKYIRRII